MIITTCYLLVALIDYRVSSCCSSLASATHLVSAVLHELVSERLMVLYHHMLTFKYDCVPLSH